MTSICDGEQVAQPGPRLPLKATTHNSTERSHPTYNTRRKKRACVPIRRNPVRHFGILGQLSVRRDLAEGSKQPTDPVQYTTSQTSPKPSSWNTSYYNRERMIRVVDPRPDIPQPRPKWAVADSHGGNPNEPLRR